MNGVNSNDTSDYTDITINKKCSGNMCKMFLLHIKNIENTIIFLVIHLFFTEI